MASIRKEILGEQLVFSERDREWTPSHDQLRAADINIDLEADQRMAAIVADRSNIVVDAWLQPWLYQAGDALRIWIESSVETRIMKTAVATMRRGEVPSSRIADVLAAKDEFSRALPTSVLHRPVRRSSDIHYDAKQLQIHRRALDRQVGRWYRRLPAGPA